MFSIGCLPCTALATKGSMFDVFHRVAKLYAGFLSTVSFSHPQILIA